MREPAFRGVFAALVTPFAADGGLDEAALRRLVDHQVAEGIAGLVACGSTGEFASMSGAERRRVVETVVDQAAGRVPVIAQTGALTTREAVDLSRHAAAAGAAAILVVPPYYAPLTPDELRGHLRAVARAVDLPIVYYHIPSCTKVALDADAIVALGRQAGFAAAKDSSGDAATLTRLLTVHRDAFLTFAGWDALCLQAFTLGARAAILGAATVVPGACAALLDAVDRGRPDDASATWRRLAPVLEFCAANGYVGAAKAACGLLGIPVGVPRPPLGALGAEQTATLAGLLRDAGFAREVSGAPAGA